MCKDCKGITLIKGEDGVGIVNIANNPNGTITVLLSNGTSYTTTSLMGPAGAAGAQGAYGGWSSNWLYNTATTNTPATTTMRFNTVSPAAATKIYINQVNAAGTTISDFLDSFKNTNDSINYYGFLKIYREASQEDDFLYVKITGYSLVSGVATIDITQLMSNGSFTANDSLVVDFTPQGPTGATGGWSSKWSFSTSVTSTPVATKLQFNNVDLDIANIIYINKINITNTLSLGDFLNAFKNTVGGINYYGLLKIYNINSPETNFWIGEITGYTAVGSVVHLNVTMIQREGVFLANDTLAVDFTPNGSTDFRPYKVYSALISQSSTSAPTAVVLENNLSGPIVWTRDSAGTYFGTLVGAFTASKTMVLLTLNYAAASVTGYAVRSSADVVMLQTINAANTGTDGKLVSASLEIRVYN